MSVDGYIEYYSYENFTIPVIVKKYTRINHFSEDQVLQQTNQIFRENGYIRGINEKLIPWDRDGILFFTGACGQP